LWPAHDAEIDGVPLKSAQYVEGQLTQPGARQAAKSLGVLVVDDDAVCRRSLQAIVGTVSGVHVVGTARDIETAKRAIERGDVSILTLDVVLKAESGLDLLSWLAAEHSEISVIVVTAGRDTAARTEVDAIFLGASALLLKPDNGASRQEFEQALCRTLVQMSERQEPRPVTPAPQTAPTAAFREVIAVGASTGGPPVVLGFLKSLRASFEVPILVVQHMPQAHVGYYAEHLQAHARRPVLLGRHGEVVQRGRVYVAPGGVHMQVVRVGSKLAIHLDDGPEEHYCRPAVDPLFRSVAAACGASSVGVVVTGMGSDGAIGATLLRKAGAPVVVQDRQSCVVWGMPGAVVRAGAASAEVPAAELAEVVMRWTSVDRKGSHDATD
jgi:two-component system chemotaxis response regulator CheB